MRDKSVRAIRASLFLLCAVWSAAAEPQKQWVIEAKQGTWEVECPGQPPTRQTEQFDVLTSACRIRCDTGPCNMTYSVPPEKGDPPIRPLFPVPRARSRQWILMSTLPDPGPPVGPSLPDLQQIMNANDVHSGGARKGGSVCSGELDLVEPTCGEMLDMQDFRVRWKAMPAEAGKVMTLLIGAADNSDRRRWNSIPVDAGEFHARAVNDYLSSIQTDHDVDVTLRLMRSENLSATRLVRLPSRAADASLRARIQTASTLPGLTRKLVLLHTYLNMGMWSKAADLGQQLEHDAPNSIEIRKFAVLGMCRSAFAAELDRLRSMLQQAGVRGYCDGDAPKGGTAK